ncbi:MAG: type IV pilus modification PilV family protein [Pseudomonadota bacterium]
MSIVELPIPSGCSVSRRLGGFTLIETIVFLLVVGIGVAGLLSAMSTAIRFSADPLPQKQALALAESLMEEITSAGFTFCQPQDPNFLSATNTAQCTAALIENVGPDTISGVTETRPFDNVNDYVDAFGTAKSIAATDLSSGIAAPAGYQASVTISEFGIAGISATESLLVKVTVTGPNNTRISLDGFRTRHAPRVSP